MDKVENEIITVLEYEISEGNVLEMMYVIDIQVDTIVRTYQTRGNRRGGIIYDVHIKYLIEDDRGEVVPEVMGMDYYEGGREGLEKLPSEMKEFIKNKYWYLYL